MSYLVKPKCMKTGNFAPGMVSTAEKEEVAIADVMSRSRLSSFKNWSFSNVKKLKTKSVKPRHSRDDE